jgi:hypothetical protein
MLVEILKLGVRSPFVILWFLVRLTGEKSDWQADGRIATKGCIYYHDFWWFFSRFFVGPQSSFRQFQMVSFQVILG